MESKFESLFRLFDEKAPDKHPVFQAAKIAEETGEAINLIFKLVGFRRESYDVEEIGERLSGELADIRYSIFSSLSLFLFLHLGDKPETFTNI